jgi:hypothetical protein
MARSLEENKLRQEWNSLPKNWYSIYQWRRTCGIDYAERIAEWIVTSFAEIRLMTDGLRDKNFKTRDHRGQATLNTGIGHFTEKRFVRALFNLGRLSPLGEMIDYEIPLKATRNADHGDIDLLCVAPESKSPRSGESILKAVLESFVYTSLAAQHRDVFVAEFQLPRTLLLTPATLTFADSPSHRQLQAWDKHPHLSALVKMLNADLAKSDDGGIRLFIIDNDKSELAFCLPTVPDPEGGEKVIFASGFIPNVIEWRNPSSCN